MNGDAVKTHCLNCEYGKLADQRCSECGLDEVQARFMIRERIVCLHLASASSLMALFTAVGIFHDRGTLEPMLAALSLILLWEGPSNWNRYALYLASGLLLIFFLTLCTYFVKRVRISIVFSSMIMLLSVSIWICCILGPEPLYPHWVSTTFYLFAACYYLFRIYIAIRFIRTMNRF